MTGLSPLMTTGTHAILMARADEGRTTFGEIFRTHCHQLLTPRFSKGRMARPFLPGPEREVNRSAIGIRRCYTSCDKV